MRRFARKRGALKKNVFLLHQMKYVVNSFKKKQLKDSALNNTVGRRRSDRFPDDVKLDVKRSNCYTGMAQGQRAGLITPRTPDRNGLPVSNHSPALQKLVVIAQATLNLSNF